MKSLSCLLGSDFSGFTSHHSAFHRERSGKGEGKWSARRWEAERNGEISRGRNKEGETETGMGREVGGWNWVETGREVI